MPNVSRLDDEDDVLGDVGRVIANPLKMSRYQDEIDRGLDDPLIAEHVGDQLPENLVSQPVQPVVCRSTFFARLTSEAVKASTASRSILSARAPIRGRSSAA